MNYRVICTKIKFKTKKLKAVGLQRKQTYACNDMKSQLYEITTKDPEQLKDTINWRIYLMQI